MGNGEDNESRTLLGKIIPLALFTSFINIHFRERKSDRKGGLSHGDIRGEAGRNHAGHKSLDFARDLVSESPMRRAFIAV